MRNVHKCNASFRVYVSTNNISFSRTQDIPGVWINHNTKDSGMKH